MMNKIFFQGTYGAYSHMAALSIYPKAEIVPCKTFDECFLKASKDSNSKIIIPESNRITGNIGIEYLIFEYRLNIYSEYFQKIEHNLLGQHGAKISDIKEVYSHAQALSQCSNFIKNNNLIENLAKKEKPQFETFWNKVVKDGGLFKNNSNYSSPKFIANKKIKFEIDSAEDRLNLYITPSYRFYDGRSSNNSWLQELPDLLTTAVWDSWIEINTKLANKLEIEEGDIVQIESDFGSKTQICPSHWLRPP